MLDCNSLLSFLTFSTPLLFKNFCERGGRVWLGSARLYMLGPPRRVSVHATHQMLWSVICVMFWWEAWVLFTSLYICDLQGGFWVLSRTLMLDSKESLQRRAGLVWAWLLRMVWEGEMGGWRRNRFEITWNVSVHVEGFLEATKGRFHISV